MCPEKCPPPATAVRLSAVALNVATWPGGRVKETQAYIAEFPCRMLRRLVTIQALLACLLLTVIQAAILPDTGFQFLILVNVISAGFYDPDGGALLLLLNY